MKGVVKWFDAKKGFGFIAGDDSGDVFVHYSNIISDGDFKNLLQGDHVQYEVEDTARGKKAVNVKLSTDGD